MKWITTYSTILLISLLAIFFEVKAGGCMSSTAHTPKIMPICGLDDPFKKGQANKITSNPTPAFSHLPKPKASRQRIYAVPSPYSSASSTSIGSAQHSPFFSTPEKLSDMKLMPRPEEQHSLEEFKEIWLAIRTSLCTIRSKICQFRHMYTQLRKSVKDEGPKILTDYLAACNNIYWGYFPDPKKTMRAPFGSVEAIEKRYSALRQLHNEAIALASRCLLMGKRSTPKLLHPHPLSDLKPLEGLRAPECASCAQAQERRGAPARMHPNFDHNAKTFDDVCPKCNNSLLLPLYMQLVTTNYIEQLRSYLQDGWTMLHCIFPGLERPEFDGYTSSIE